ncbi:MAG: hypothetical protein M3Z24_17330, partial [Chloroflexota bacterium]|nr:hypothetical protein [Chloroflexota bacterium]
LSVMKNAFYPNPNVQNFLAVLPTLDWYYRLDTSRIDTGNIDTVAAGISKVLESITNGPNAPPFVTNTQSSSPASAALSSFSSRVSVVQIPVVSLSLMVLALMLFFVSMMIDILVERQINAITVMRSRGASRRQITTSLTVQSTGLGLLGLIVGPLLAIALVQLIAGTTLAAAHQNALNIIRGNAGPVFQELLYYALGTTAILLLTMAIAIRRAAKLDVVMLRRETGRSTNRPIWQRIGLDMIAALIALLGYAASVYITSPGVLDVQVRALIVPPVTLLEVLFLLIAATLLFLRFFPDLLRLAATLVARGRSATPMLALAQMARAPQQSLRMTMLLAFAIAFAFFTLSFTASQTQRSTDVGNYQVGADFSAHIPSLSRADTSALYTKIPGVLSATVGYRAAPRVTQSVQSGVDMTFELMAVDANTFTQTAIWNEQDSSQPLSSLMKHLLAERKYTLDNPLLATSVPVIVDETAVKSLDLSIGSHFSIADNFNNPLDCTVIDIVHRIPSILPNGINYGNVLVDYVTYAKLSAQINSTFIPTNQVWLHTRDDAKSITSVGKALNNINLTLTDINDRRAITRNLNQDPLTTSLIMILLIGAITAMVLALVGNLIASWISVRSRMSSFVVLRALGTAPPQVARMITLEQSIIYITSFVLGTVFGFVLTVLAVPALVFTNVAISGLTSDLTSENFYSLQSVPPPQIVFPLSLLIALSILVLICVLALGLMMYLASRPSISQTLRLNED